MSDATKVENTRNICAGAAFAIERGNGPVTTTYATTDDGWTVSADIATEAVYGSAVNETQSAKSGRKAVWGSANTNENLPSQNYFLQSRLNIMHGERVGIQVHHQHDTSCMDCQLPPKGILDTPSHLNIMHGERLGI